MNKDLKVKYGMINYGEEREKARGSFEYIVEDIADIKKRYVSLGFHLCEFNRCEYYKDFGYSTFMEFCEANLLLDKSAISRCMNVWRNFCDRQGSSSTMWLADKWKDYSYSQLCEIVSMNDNQRKLVKPDMTVKQLRDIKKTAKSNFDEQQVATSQLEEIVILYGSFKDDIFIADLLGRCKQFIMSTNMAVENLQISGKRLTFQDEKGDTYSIQFAVSKK